MYTNRRTNFISVPLGGLAPDVYSPLRYSSDSANIALKSALASKILCFMIDCQLIL